MSSTTTQPSGNRKTVFHKLARLLGWTRASYTLLGAFVLTVGLILYIWWPLAEEYLAQVDWQGEWWRYTDWLLLGLWAFMTLMLMAGADFRADMPMILVGLGGGLAIESWGTQTELWTYYTLERPPLWIIPAWPIAALTIDRLVRLTNKVIPERVDETWFKAIYWIIFPAFMVLMLSFIWWTYDKSQTITAILACVLMIISPTDYRVAVLTFLAGAGLGYFLELWGTTRLCWTYYTLELPPVFAVFAHGMAAVAFWRTLLLVLKYTRKVFPGWFKAGLEPSAQQEKNRPVMSFDRS